MYREEQPGQQPSLTNNREETANSRIHTHRLVRMLIMPIHADL